MKKRSGFFNTNRYQRQVIVLAFCPVLIIYGVIAVLLKMMQGYFLNITFFSTPEASYVFVSHWIGLIHSVTLMVLVLVLCYTYVLSSNLVGAFERVLGELDDIIGGKRREKITVRDKDALARDVLDRINVLVERLMGK